MQKPILNIYMLIENHIKECQRQKQKDLIQLSSCWVMEKELDVGRRRTERHPQHSRNIPK